MKGVEIAVGVSNTIVQRIIKRFNVDGIFKSNISIGKLEQLNEKDV